MAFWDMYKTSLEKAIEARGQKVMAGGYNFWQDPQFRPAVEGIRTAGARNLEDLTAVLPRANVGGPAAAKMLENASARTSGDVLNLGTNMATALPEKYIGEGVQAGNAGWGRLMDMINAKEAYESRHTQTQMAKQQGQASAGKQIGSYFGSGITSGMSGGGGGCCFIFIEGNRLTDNVRNLRDEMFPRGGIVENGYRRLARWLVPRMAKNWFVKKIVKVIMLNPICSVADCYYGENSYGWVFIPVAHFWRKVCERLGK